MLSVDLSDSENKVTFLNGIVVEIKSLVYSQEETSIWLCIKSFVCPGGCHLGSWEIARNLCGALELF